MKQPDALLAATVLGAAILAAPALPASASTIPCTVFRVKGDDATTGQTWAFRPVRDLSVTPGSTSVAIRFYSPDGPSPLAVDTYEVAISQGTKLGNQIEGYPSFFPKSTTTSCEIYYGPASDSMKPGTEYVLGVRAMAHASHASPWAEKVFTTTR
jgi:hypothetical protein